MEGMEGMEDIVEEFLVESHENLDQLDRDLVQLELDPDSRELLSSVFRTLHTIKGTSGFLAFGILETVTHAGENLLSRMRDGDLSLDPAVTTVLLEMVDAVRVLLGDIEKTGREGEHDYSALLDRVHQLLAPEVDTAPAREQMLAGVGASTTEHHAARPNSHAETTLPAHISELPHFDDSPEAPDDAPRRTLADSTIRVDVALLDSLMNLVGELVLTRNQLVQTATAREDIELQRTTHRLNLIAGELQEEVMKTRMQPIDNVWNKLPRVVRDLSLALGKSVSLQLDGGETELDKTILEAVRDPLTHLVRNAVDHGIEDRATRRAQGKPEHGTLHLRAFHEGGQVNVEISDDGAGIDPVKVRQRAVDRGMLGRDECAALSDHEAMALIFAPGFSTATVVTNVSGRGVGMDVVRTNIEKIGGSIDLASTPGLGTTVRIRIPLTLAIIPAVVVACAGQRYAIPQVNLLELVRLDTADAGAAIEKVHGAPVYRLRERLLPLVDLRDQLEQPARASSTTYIAVLQADGRRFGLMLDDIHDTEEIVVKPLGRQLRDIPVYAGATIMGDGQIALILDVGALARSAGMTSEPGAPASAAGVDNPAAERATLLVVALADSRRAAIDLACVDRLEEFERRRIERSAGREVVQYRDRILPLLDLEELLGRTDPTEGPRQGPLQVVVCRSGGRLVGLVVASVLDIVENDLAVRTDKACFGLRDSAVVDGVVTELVDIDDAVASLLPDAIRA